MKYPPYIYFIYGVLSTTKTINQFLDIFNKLKLTEQTLSKKNIGQFIHSIESERLINQEADTFIQLGATTCVKK